ncbi:MAG TPA: DUF1343 domain-containing protein [Longimicrobiales bacterium]
MGGLPLWLQYTLVTALGCGTSGNSASPAPRSQPTVIPGIEVLVRSHMDTLRGLRIGLITNHTGKTRSGESSIDVLHQDARVQLVALFAPEHGIRGAVEGGVTIETERDSRTGLPIRSLYGATLKPTPEMLRDIDALVFDIQDIGARYYTYPWTMVLAMQAAAENGKRFVVLDRPNPIGGELVQGNINDTTSFVGLYPVPMRHGMTVGEIARFVNREYNINANLLVIPVGGLTRRMWFEDTRLPWTPPSPNMPSIESATHYPGLCVFEGTNLSVGRGTPTAFQMIGAPWLDARELARRMSGHKFPGVRFEAMTFTPARPGDNKYDNQLVNGVRFITTNRRTYDPTRVALAALLEVRAMHAAEFKWQPSFARLYGVRGTRALIEGGATYDQLTAAWDSELAKFEARRLRYLLY